MSYSYQKIRRFSSNCHVYSFSPNEFRFDATLGTVGKLEKLSKINGEPTADEYTIAKINGNVFRFNGTKEIIGSYVDDGKYYSPNEEFYPTLVFWKDGINAKKLTIQKNPTQKQLVDYQMHAYWAMATLWSLIIDGKQNFTYPQNTVYKVFSHAASRCPRTMIGQKKDGTIIWVVVDGRKLTSPGITLMQEYTLMNELGCYVACNVDGGGSSEMIVNGSIVNNPSDGAERSIGSALMCYAKKNVVNTQKKGITTASLLNVRKGSNTKYARIGELSKGSTVYVVAIIGNWYKIVYGNTYGYVSKQYVKLV